MNKLKRLQKLLQINFNYWRKNERLNYLPLRLWIEATSCCNLRCVMCPQSEPTYIERGFIEFSLFKKIIDEAKAFVYDVNLHHRGESLLHPDLAEMIDYARKAGLYTRLHTNATLLNANRAQEIIGAGLDFISFSFDGFTKENYESIRRNAKFEETVNNISDFLILKEKSGRKKPFTVFETMELGEVKTKDYRLVRAALRDKLYSLHLDKFVIKSPHNWAGSYAGKDEKSGQSAKFSACTFPWFAMVILWNGDVSPCPQDFFGCLIMGNLLQSSIAEIWSNNSYISIREAMKQKKVEGLNPCYKCDMLCRHTFLGIPTPNLKIFLKEIFWGNR